MLPHCGFALHFSDNEWCWTFKEIILRCGLPNNLQGDNGPSLTAKLTQELSPALGINYCLHSPWRNKSPGKVKETNHVLKSMVARLCPETSESWVSLLPVALLRTRMTPKGILNLAHLKWLQEVFLDFRSLMRKPIKWSPTLLAWAKFKGPSKNMETKHCPPLWKKRSRSPSSPGTLSY